MLHEALIELEQYAEFKKHVKIPILANITEFGQTPLFNCEQLNKAGVDMVLYPLSAFRAMSKAAEAVYLDINKNGTHEFRSCLYLNKLLRLLYS